MSLTIKQKDTSLKKAIDKASRKVQQIRDVCINYCNKYQGRDCEGRVTVDNYDVDAAYQIVRREPIFNGFVVKHDVKIVVIQTQNLGELVDLLLHLGIYQIEQLQWKPHTQVDTIEKAIDAGVTKAKQLCKHINRKVGTVLSILEVYSEDKKQQEEQQKTDASNPQEEQDQQKPSLLKFEVECVGQMSQQEQKNKKGQKQSAKKKKKTKQK